MKLIAFGNVIKIFSRQGRQQCLVVFLKISVLKNLGKFRKRTHDEVSFN